MEFGKVVFELTKEHIALVRKMAVTWQHCEFGAPEINPKRPYGNSDAYTDMAEILGIRPEGDLYDMDDEDSREFSEEQEVYMDKLHEGTEKALAILIGGGKFTPGTYTNEEYGYGKWSKSE